MLYLGANTAILLLAWRITPWIAPAGGPWLRAMTTLFFGMALILGFTLFTGLLGLLNAPMLVLIPWLFLLVWMGWERGESPPDEGRSGSPGVETTIAAVVLAATLGLWFAGPGWQGTDFIFDDITYHAAVPVQWLLNGEIGYSNLTYQSYYPFNAELLGTWSLVLQGELTNSGVGVLLVVLLTALGTLAFMENLGVGSAPVLALLALLFASPEMLHFSHTFSANDLTVTAFFLCALAFATAAPTRRAALWCGLALGAALGTKVSIAIGVLLVGLWWLWRGRRDPALPVLLVLASFLLGGWWYGHNLFLTGNPLFPAELGPFDGPLDKAAQHRTSLLYFMEKKGGTWGWWWDLFYDRLDWPFPVGLAALFGYLVALRAGVDEKKRGAWLAFAVGISFLLIHPFQPYSGSVNRPNGTLHSMVRYLTLPIVLGLPLWALLTQRGSRREQALTLLVLLGWCGPLAGLFPALSAVEVGWLFAGAVIGLGLVALPSLPQRARFLGPAFLALVLISWRTEAKRPFTAEKVLTFSPAARIHTAGWRVVDALADGHQVAWISDLPSSHTFAVPLYGARFQHQLVPVDRFGRRLEAPLHERFAAEPDPWWTPFKRLPKKGVPVLENLLASGADTLVISRCQHSPKGPWPRPRATLLATGKQHRLHQDRCVEVWNLAPFQELDLVEATPRRKK